MGRKNDEITAPFWPIRLSRKSLGILQYKSVPSYLCRVARLISTSLKRILDMTQKLIAFVFLLAPYPALLAQTDLPAAIKTINAELLEVGSDKLTITQKVEQNAAKPYRVVFTRTTTDAKGKQTVEAWDLNLADLDKNTVRWEDSKESIKVPMTTNRRQKYIRHLKNGVLDAYTDDLLLYAKNVDNARNLEKAMEAAIPLAKDAWEKDVDLKEAPPETLLKRLCELIGEVTVGDDIYKQKLEPAGDFPDRLKLRVEEYGSKGVNTTETYIWSVGDLNDPSLRLQIQGKNAYLQAGTKRNLRWVAYTKGDERGYDNEVRLRVADPDQGKLVQAILQKLIVYGEAQIRQRLPTPANADEALKQLAATQQAFAVEKTNYEQTLAGSCLTQLTQRKTAEKSTESLEYRFHFGDLNSKSVALDIRAKNLALEMTTVDKENLIAVFKNGEQQNYNNDVSLLLPDLETARRAEHLALAVVDKCRQTIVPKDFDWVRNTLSQAGSVAKETNLTQKLELQEAGNNCKWRFTKVESTDKKTSESIYEFNLYDLDPKNLGLKVSGKKVTLQANTKYRQKIISEYKEGKPSYTADFQLVVADVETAKILRETWSQLMAQCKQ